MNRVDLAEALIALTETGSVHQAAVLLNQTDAAVSRKITKLEDYLGAKVVHRDRNGAKLTDIGKQYYQRCKDALAAFEQAEQFVRHQTGEPRGQLTIAATQFHANEFILPKLEAFSNQYPEIQVRLNIAESVPETLTSKMDVIFGSHLSKANQLEQKCISKQRFVLCAAKNYLEAKGKPQSVNDLKDHAFIASSARKNANCIYINGSTEVKLEPSLWINETSCIIDALLQGMGFAWLPEQVVKQHLKSGALVELLPDLNRGTYPDYLYFNNHNPMDPKVRAFVEWFTGK